jgi:DNA-binding transcriptional ArsR family regulator
MAQRYIVAGSIHRIHIRTRSTSCLDARFISSFERNYRALDRVFRALADPTRRTIIERLSDGDASVSDLAEPLPISLAAVVQHVQALEQSGLIHTDKAGRVRTCRLEPQALRLLDQWNAQRCCLWQHRLPGS